ncbi:MAG: ArsR/SmtB family transcription factor [Nitrospinota bacterium]
MSDVCEVEFVDREKVESVRKAMKSERAFYDTAEIFKLLGDSTRTKLLFALSREELCVCDLANLLGLSGSAVSHQLRLLRNMKVVKFRKEGKMVYYSLDDSHILNLFTECLKHVEHG